MRAKIFATIAASAIALTAAAPAHATTWDGNAFQFGLGSSWELNDFYIEDVYLGDSSVPFTQPYDENIYTDIWDGGLKMFVTSPTLGLDAVEYNCNGVTDDIDITTDGDDLSIDCLTDWNEPSDPDVSITGNIRIYGPDGDLVRYVLQITNNSASDVTDFELETTTDFGSSGDIWGYQNFDAGILGVPADENSDNSAALEDAGANWIVNYDGNDASGSLAWGTSGVVPVDVAVDETSSDTFYTRSDTFTVAAGETVYFAYFTGWNPQGLLDLGYTDGSRFPSQTESEADADSVVALAAEFNDFTGRLTSGLPAGANVANWGTVPASDEDLAETGVDASGIALGGALALATGVAVVVRRRARA